MNRRDKRTSWNAPEWKQISTCASHLCACEFHRQRLQSGCRYRVGCQHCYVTWDVIISRWTSLRFCTSAEISSSILCTKKEKYEAGLCIHTWPYVHFTTCSLRVTCTYTLQFGSWSMHVEIQGALNWCGLNQYNTVFAGLLLYELFSYPE